MTARLDPARSGSLFLSLWQPPHDSKTVLEEFSLSDGRPVRQLASLPEDASGPHTGPEGTAWLTMSTGPRERNNTAGGDPAPNSCSGSVVRLDLPTRESKTVLSFPSSQLVDDVVPNPSGQLLAMLAGTCDRSYFNQHLLVKDLRSGQEWTIGADAAPCHALYTPSWSPDGSKLVFAYGPANSSERLPETPRSGLGKGVCTQNRPGEVAVVPAERSSQLSSARLIPPPKGCSYQAAVFDRQGIAAVDGCEQGTPRAYAGLGDYQGDAYLVQLNGRGRTVLRLALRRESNITRLASDPSAGLVFVSEGQGENTRPAFDWVWTFDGHRLRAVGHYNAHVTAEPW
jgi:Tol biopolymer transport system component